MNELVDKNKQTKSVLAAFFQIKLGIVCAPDPLQEQKLNAS
jgi:hypothetical protein